MFGVANSTGMTKTQLTQLISEKTNLPRTQIALVFDLLADLAVSEIAKNGTFVIPDLVKFVVKEANGKKRMTVSAVGDLKKRLIV